MEEAATAALSDELTPFMTGVTCGGMGVHVAARVTDLAGAGEILATLDTLREAGLEAGAETREVSLKGVPGTVVVSPVRPTRASHPGGV